MSLELSLYTIESDLANLIEMREQAAEEIAEIDSGMSLMTSRQAVIVRQGRADEISVIDRQIREYVAAEIRKVDGIRGYWRHAELMRDAAKAEADVQALRAKAWDQRLKRLKEMCLTVMEAIPFPPGKPKKLEGRTGSLMLRGNGGKQAVEIHDEALVPDEMKMVTVMISRDQWQLKAALFRDPKIVSCAPSLSLIGAELERACEHCDGAPAVGTKDECQWCGGSGKRGKRGVPGARLAPRGQHVECK